MKRRSKDPKRIVKRECFVDTKEGRIPLILTRSSGRKTLVITVSDNANASVAAPFNMPDQVIANFLLDRADWICKKIKVAQNNRDILDQKEFDDGHRFLFLGKKHKLNVVGQNVRRNRISFDLLLGWEVVVPRGISSEIQRSYVKDKMLQWYRVQAKEILGGRVYHYSRILGVAPKNIAVRTQKRLWGCCDYHKQSINLNWQIILSPLSVIDYVVVHELCHLTIPNHSKRFWKMVEKVMPDYKQRKQWLKANHIDMILP